MIKCFEFDNETFQALTEFAKPSIIEIKNSEEWEGSITPSFMQNDALAIFLDSTNSKKMILANTDEGIKIKDRLQNQSVADVLKTICQ